MSLAIDSLYIGVRVRAVGDPDWLDLNCEVDSTGHIQVSQTTTKTKCGPFSGFQTADTDYSGNAVWDVDDGDAAASYATIRDWMLGNTTVQFLRFNKAYTQSDGTPVNEGAQLHEYSTGQFTDTQLQSPIGDLAKFSWAFKPDSAIVTTGASA